MTTAPRPTAPSRQGLSVLVWAALGLGVLTCLARLLGPDGSRLPGDLGDCRFVAYTLEHGYRFLTGQADSFWNAAFYYPMTRTVALSDNMAGALPLYALGRLFVADPLAAMGLWFGLTCLLNYLVSAWAYARMGAHPLAAAVGAFAPAFGLLVAANTHPQSLQLYPVSLALCALWTWANEPTPRRLALLALATLFLALCSFYFLTFFLPVAVLGLALFWARTRCPPTRHLASLRPNRLAWPVMGLCLGLLALNYWPHFEASRLTGAWDWDIVRALSPKPASFLFPTAGSLLWRDLEAFGQGLPHPGEHRLFFGASLLAGGVWGVWTWLRPARPGQALSAALVTAGLLLALFCLDVDGHSLLHELRRLPGLASLRSVTRLAFVLSVLLGLGLALFLGALLDRLDGRAAWLAALAALGLVALDQHVRPEGFLSFARAESAARVRAVSARVPADCRVFFALPAARDQTVEAVYEQLDAMMAAQALGKATYNGYSGWLPPLLGAFYFEPTCARLDDWRNTAQALYRPETPWRELYAGSALAGLDPCPPDPALMDRLQGRNERSIPPSERKARVRAELAFDPQAGRLTVRARVTNLGQATVHGLGDFFHRRAVHVNILVQDATGKELHMPLRRLDHSLKPGETLAFTDALALPPGCAPVSARLYLFQAQGGDFEDPDGGWFEVAREDPAQPVARASASALPASGP